MRNTQTGAQMATPVGAHDGNIAAGMRLAPRPNRRPTRAADSGQRRQRVAGSGRSPCPTARTAVTVDDHLHFTVIVVLPFCVPFLAARAMHATRLQLPGAT